MSVVAECWYGECCDEVNGSKGVEALRVMSKDFLWALHHIEPSSGKAPVFYSC
jgi:hypothetical protein